MFLYVYSYQALCVASIRSGHTLNQAINAWHIIDVTNFSNNSTNQSTTSQALHQFISFFIFLKLLSTIRTDKMHI